MITHSPAPSADRAHARTMPRPLTRALKVTGSVLASAVVLLAYASPASAASGDRSVTVSPSSGLKDGQTVQLSGTGFTPNKSLFVVECVSNASGASGCDIKSLTQPKTDSKGSFSGVAFTVAATFSGHDCTKEKCIVQAAEGASPSAPRGTSSVLSFGSSAPTTSSSAPTTSSSAPTTSSSAPTTSSSAPPTSSTGVATNTGTSASTITSSTSQGNIAVGGNNSSGAAGSGSTQQPGLAYTGTQTYYVAGLGIALLILGGGAVWLSTGRRTRRAH